MNQFLKKLVPSYLKKMQENIDLLNQRITVFEQGLQNRRSSAIYDLADYLVGAQIEGDYCEFGVYKGDTFKQAYKLLSGLFPNMNFYGFDSFEGLPEPRGLDALNGYTSNFHENEFSVSEDVFNVNLQNNNVDMKRVKTIKGWFDKTLKGNNSQKYGIKSISAAWIDCDLYESTIPVLDFILPYLNVGSVIIFDDWRCFRNLPDFGEQRACKEWLMKNPTVSLSELFSFGFHGCAFTVVSK